MLGGCEKAQWELLKSVFSLLWTASLSIHLFFPPLVLIVEEVAHLDDT